MKLILSKVTAREIVSRRTAFVARAEQQLRSGFQDLSRHAGPRLAGEFPNRLTTVIEDAGKAFETELSRFVDHFGGFQLGVDADGLMRMMFDRYFEDLPPFGGGRDKKHEFPDAAVLLSLERFAADHGIGMVLVSKDKGWTDFAAGSSRLYCVETIQELAGLFESTSVQARALRAHLSRQLVSDPRLLQRVQDVVRARLPEMQWALPGSGDYRYTISPSVSDVHVQAVHTPSGDVRVWIAGNEKRHCVAQFPVEADVVVDVEALINDRYRPDDPPEYVVEHTMERVEAQVLMRISGDLTDVNGTTFNVDLDLVNDEFRVAPQFRSSRLWSRIPKSFSGFDDMDDIPF